MTQFIKINLVVKIIPLYFLKQNFLINLNKTKKKLYYQKNSLVIKIVYKKMMK